MNSFTFVDPMIAECKFASEPVIIWVNKFDEESAKDFSVKMSLAQITGQPAVPIIIDSYGGNGYSLFSMISDIQNSAIPVSTIAKGKAMSAGAILMTCGTPGFRFVDRNARVMIHEAASANDWSKISDLESSAEEVRRLNTQIYEIMALNCKKKPTYFIKEMHKRNNVDWFLSAEEAVQIKMADYVGIPQMKREVSLNWVFEHGG